MDPKSVNVLIGEDDGVVALDLQSQLRLMGYQVESRAGTPSEVAALAKDRKPDVIVLDFNLGGDTHGLEMAQQIHQIAQIPIVFVTAFAADILDRDPVIPKPYRYLTKPLVPLQLHAAIQELLAQAEA